MFQFEHNGQIHSVRFQYDPIVYTSDGIPDPEQRRKTTVFLDIIDRSTGKAEYTPIMETTISTHFKDRFTRKGGRIRALERILNRMGYDKTMRKTVWDAYWKMTNPTISRGV